MLSLLRASSVCSSTTDTMGWRKSSSGAAARAIPQFWQYVPTYPRTRVQKDTQTQIKLHRLPKPAGDLPGREGVGRHTISSD
jgi:hypothetical protein